MISQASPLDIARRSRRQRPLWSLSVSAEGAQLAIIDTEDNSVTDLTSNKIYSCRLRYRAEKSLQQNRAGIWKVV